MTTVNAITSTSIPSNINTLERLAAWAVSALSVVNPTARTLETPGLDPERVAVVQIIKAEDGTTRLIGRISIPIDPNYPTNTTKFWQNAQEISNTALPTAFTSN